MRPALVLFILLPLLGCDRPFVAPAEPELEVLEPDLSAVQAEPTVRLRLRAASFRPVERVEVGGEAAEPVGGGAYVAEVALARGLNRIPVVAFDVGGVAGTDTLFALHLPLAAAEAAASELPVALGGLAAAPLPNGGALVAGGAPTAGAPPTPTAFRLDPGTLAFARTDTLRHARVGHTLSPLPDGRVVVAGGARRLDPAGLGDFVETPELYDPVTGRFAELQIVTPEGEAAPPIRRTRHAALVRPDADGRPVLYLYGGVGNRARFGEPSLGPLEFVRVFRIEDEAGGVRLVALGPPERFRLTAAAGHALTPLGQDRYLVSGTAAGAAHTAPLPFRLTFAPERFRTEAVPPLAPARTDHVAAPFASETVFVGGGRGAAGEALAHAALYADGAGAFFRLSGDLLDPRWGAAATNLGAERILVVGGFANSGTALARSVLIAPTTAARPSP